MTLSINPVQTTRAREGVIIAALRSGDVRRAVELLFEAYQDEVYAYCARLVGPVHAVRAYHRVLAAAIDDLAERDSTTSLRAWLFGIARRTITHLHQVGQAAGQALDPHYVPVSTVVARGGCPIPVSDVDGALAELDPQTREIVQLTLWHGLTLAEVAKVIERSESSVRELAGEGIAHVAMRCHRHVGRSS